MARYIAVLEVVAAPIGERRCRIRLRPGMSASHVVCILVDHRMLCIGIHGTDAAYAERALVLIGYIGRRVERRAVAERRACRIHEQRYRIRAVKFSCGAQAHGGAGALRRQRGCGVDVVVCAVHLAHPRQAIGIEPVEPVGHKHIVHLLNLRPSKFLKRLALPRHIRLRPYVIRNKHIHHRRSFRRLRIRLDWFFWLIAGSFFHRSLRHSRIVRPKRYVRSTNLQVGNRIGVVVIASHPICPVAATENYPVDNWHIVALVIAFIGQHLCTIQIKFVAGAIRIS